MHSYYMIGCIYVLIIMFLLTNVYIQIDNRSYQTTWWYILPASQIYGSRSPICDHLWWHDSKSIGYSQTYQFLSSKAPFAFATRKPPARLRMTCKVWKLNFCKDPMVGHLRICAVHLSPEISLTMLNHAWPLWVNGWKYGKQKLHECLKDQTWNDITKRQQPISR